MINGETPETSSQKRPTSNTLIPASCPANTSNSSFATQLGGEAMGIRTENEQLEPGRWEG